MAETVQNINEFIHQLHLIYNDIVEFPVFNSIMDIMEHRIWIPQILVHSIFKINTDDMVICHTIFQQIVIKQNIQEV